MSALGLTMVLLLEAGPKPPPAKPVKPTAPAVTAAPAAPNPSVDKPPEKTDDDTLAAKKYFQWAQSLYKQARYSEAIAKFEEAYRLKPHPTIFFNIGRCYEQLNDIPRALKNYRDYLRIAPEAKDRELVSDAIANLERRLKEQGVQQLSVLTDPTGARITVDEKYMGLSPLSLELKPGNRLIGISKEGFESIDKNVVLSAEKSMEITISLKPKAPPVEVAKVTPPVLTPRADIIKPVEPPPPPPPPASRTYTWVAAAVGAAGLAGGITMGLLANSASMTLRGSLHDQAAAQGLHDRAASLGLGSNISYAVAGTGLAAAIVLFFLEPKLNAPKAVASAAP